MVQLGKDLFQRRKKQEQAAEQPVAATPAPAPPQPVEETPAQVADKHDVTIDRKPQDGTRWKNLVVAFMSNFQEWRLVATMREAFSERSNGKQVLTYREADILVRRKLEPDSVKLALVNKLGNILTESENKDIADIFGLRIRYNNGLIWRNTKSQFATPEACEKGEKMIALIAEELNKLLPMHSFEVEDGFAPELLMPEWTVKTELAAKIIKIGSGR